MRFHEGQTVLFKPSTVGYIPDSEGKPYAMNVAGPCRVIAAHGDSWPFNIGPPLPFRYREWIAVRHVDLYGKEHIQPIFVNTEHLLGIGK